MAHSTGTLSFSSFHNVIAGQLVDASKTYNTLNPSTLDPNPQVPLSGPEDVDKAVEAARLASTCWAQTPLRERQQAVARFADALETNRDGFSTMLVKEQGKSFPLAQMEVDESLRVLRGIAALPFSEESERFSNGQRAIIRHVPIGVALGIVPWNYPVYLACFKLASALITGNAFILKPSPYTPYCGLKLAELGQDIFPPGVFQALSGDDALGPLLTSHPGIGKVSFTGSVATGKRVMESCSGTLKRVTLELGGNDPAIVCGDVDIASTAAQITQLARMNSGQTCIAIKRVYVHDSIYEKFLDAMKTVLQSLRVGDGFDEGIFIGPVQNAQQYDKVQDILKDCDQTGLRSYKAPDTFPTGRGHFIPPLIVENPPDKSRIVQEEPFGPIFPVLKWNDESDVISRANDSDVGLGTSVWTRDMARAERIARQWQAGNVWINAHAALDPDFPFAGHKNSGIGCELGVEGLNAYCNVQVMHLGPMPHETKPARL